MTRTGSAERSTAETTIRIRVDLDGTGRATIGTPIGFLDHVLTLFARHALIDLEVDATGDTHIDEHHTVEDTALVLGRAIDQALGERTNRRADLRALLQQYTEEHSEVRRVQNEIQTLERETIPRLALGLLSELGGRQQQVEERISSSGGGTICMPAANTAARAMSPPASPTGSTQPSTTSSTLVVSRPFRSRSSSQPTVGGN